MDAGVLERFCLDVARVGMSMGTGMAKIGYCGAVAEAPTNATSNSIQLSLTLGAPLQLMGSTLCRPFLQLPLQCDVGMTRTASDGSASP